MDNIKEQLDSLRKQMRDSLVEILETQAETEDGSISALMGTLSHNKERATQILLSLGKDDRSFLEDYIYQKIELESKKAAYLFNQGVALGYTLHADPYYFYFGEKHDHI